MSLDVPQHSDSPAEVVRKYFEASRRHDAEALADLFLPEGRLYQAPSQTLVEGRDAIRQFYKNVFDNTNALPNPGPLLVDGARVAVEIDLVNAPHPHAADFFTIVNGLIQNLSMHR